MLFHLYKRSHIGYGLIKSIVGVMILSLTVIAAPMATAAMKDDPILSMLNVDQLELASGTQSPINLDAQAWLGYDLQKILVKIESERQAGKTEQLEFQFLYSKALITYWNLQIGARHNRGAAPNSTDVVIGIYGLAPYFIDLDSALFVEKTGAVSLRVNVEYELMLSQKLALSPEIELNYRARTDDHSTAETGLTEIDIALRLSYEINRELAPYIGMSWVKTKDQPFSADQPDNSSSNEAFLLMGVSFWF